MIRKERVKANGGQPGKRGTRFSQAFAQFDADPDAVREREADEFRAMCKPFDFLPIETFGSVMIE